MRKVIAENEVNSCHSAAPTCMHVMVSSEYKELNEGPREDNIHYFFTCPLYNASRFSMYFYQHGYYIHSVLYGNPNVDPRINKRLSPLFTILSNLQTHFI